MLVVLRGIPGVGKSHFCNEYFESNQVLSEDAFRDMLFENRKYKPRSEEVHDIMEIVLEQRMKQGLPTVIDAHNLRVKHANRWIRVAEKYHNEYIVMSFLGNIDICRNRSVDRVPTLDLDKDLVEMNRKYLVCMKDFHELYGRRFKEFPYTKLDMAIDFLTDILQERYCREVTDDQQAWLIGDPHACHLELMSLMSKCAQISQRDGKKPRFFILGDIIDRGPSAYQTFLACKYFNATLIQGNHESSFIEEHFHDKKCKSIARQKTHEEFSTWSTEDQEMFLSYLTSATHIMYLEKDGEMVVLTHGGVHWDLVKDGSVPHKFGCNGAMYEDGDFGVKPDTIAMQVHGHAKWNYDPEYQEMKNGVVNIDAGVVYGDGLVAFDPFSRTFQTIESKETYYVYNPR